MLATRRIAQATAILTLGLGLPLVASTAASAAVPDRFPLEFHGTGTVDCGTFQDNFVDDLIGAAVVNFDSTGNPIRVVIHWEHTSTDVNSATGLTLHEHGRFTETIDLLTGTDSFTGNQEIMNRPEFGAIVQDTGRQVFNADGELIFFAGGRKHSQVLLGDQPFCDGLA